MQIPKTCPFTSGDRMNFLPLTEPNPINNLDQVKVFNSTTAIIIIIIMPWYNTSWEELYCLLSLNTSVWQSLYFQIQHITSQSFILTCVKVHSPVYSVLLPTHVCNFRWRSLNIYTSFSLLVSDSLFFIVSIMLYSSCTFVSPGGVWNNNSTASLKRRVASSITDINSYKGLWK